MNPLHWPQWLRVQLVAVAWAVFMYLRLHDGPPSMLVAVAALVSGEIFALGTWLMIRLDERRRFGKLSEPERAAVGEAVRTARIPDDPRLAESAIRVARDWAAARKRLVAQTVVLAAFLILSLYLAIAVTAWFWIGALAFPAVTWLATRTELRQRDAAVRYLQAAEQSTSAPATGR